MPFIQFNGWAKEENWNWNCLWIPHVSWLWDWNESPNFISINKHVISPLTHTLFFFFFSLWRHLNPQSTFNVCLQSFMDVYFVYCWFAKSMFCVTDNVVYSIVWDFAPLPPGCKNICLCSNQRLFMSGSSLSACLFSVSFFFFFPPLCKTSIRWTCLWWFVF